jgi:charged multivesicular body protein 4
VLEKRVAAEVARAKAALAANNRGGATLCLRRKALLLKQVEVVDNHILRLTEQLSQLEANQANVDYFAAIKVAAKVQKANMAEMKVEKIDKVMEDIQEAGDRMAEVQQAFALPTGAAAEIDEDDLAAELAEMEAEALDAELLAPAKVAAPAAAAEAVAAAAAPAAAEAALPSAPSGAPGRPPGAAKTTDEELADLEAELLAS